jgi:hypothetical protein
MPNQGGFKNNKFLARYACPEEEQDLRKLVAWSNPFSSVATQLVVGIGTRVGLKAAYQSFPVWSGEFVAKLLRPEFYSERRSLLGLAKGHEIRAAMAIVILYAFGQHARARDLSDSRCDQDLIAIKALRGQAEQCMQEMEPQLKYLQDAPGIWPGEVDELRQAMIRIQEIVHRPSGKNCRKSAHRDVDYTLLHWITYFSGCKFEPVGSIPPRQSWFGSTLSWILRLLARGMLGALTRIEKIDCFSWAIVAELAAGAQKPRSIATLITLYYESDKRGRVSKHLRRHADYHLGRKPVNAGA